jgi:hypothetical protein
MAYKKPHSGFFEPMNKEKYKGNSTHCTFRSNLELTYMKFFDMNEHIIAWASENVKISYYNPMDKKQHIYYPDFIIQVKKSDGTIKTQVVEIKPYRETLPPKLGKNKNTKTMMYQVESYTRNTSKWNAARDYCAAKNWDFIILTEKDV